MGDRLIVAVAIMIVAALGALGLFVWRFFMELAPEAARLWALIATAALVPCGWFFWWLGHTEARGVLAGLDKGVDRVFSAAANAVDIKVTATKRIRDAAQDPAPIVVLPPSQPAFTMRHQLPAGDRVELD